MLTHLTDTITQLITNLYVTTGLLGIIIAMAIESCCIPLPSEIVMPVAGFMLASGKLLGGVNSFVGLLLVALAGAVGCLLGSIVAYWIGYTGGRPLMLKYGRYVLISQHDADKADHFFQRWGSATTFFSRLLPVVRTYISLPAGIARMPFAKFCIYTLLGSFPWCLLLAYVGTVFGNNRAALGPIFRSLDIVIVVAFVALVVLYVWRHIRNDRKARERAALADASNSNGQAAMQSPLPQSQQAQPWSQAQAPSMPSSWGQQPQPPQPPQQYQRQARDPHMPQQQPAQPGWGGPTASPPQTPQQQWDRPQAPQGHPGWQQPPIPPQPQPGQGQPPSPPLQQHAGWGQSAYPPQQQEWVQFPLQAPPFHNGHHHNPDEPS